ncbi:hypothetical protein, variant 1 [Aphanomyces invadans]|uniref:Uncharacterized protein n=1 Tax=Aphanomyces invadans TaxID=157072 RepID=A0A024TYV7_9STRA|nr:hypothetical protein, variant 1 [Aphanomyces invadans]ETV98806.1 hypothetical protein, variant 1 [Aphanomyces invadans]|eukprot:XP_008872233.1 hypothetical protein, variant 1 [Aphanomyces invadans]
MMKTALRSDAAGSFDRSAAFMGHEYALEAEECAQAGNLRRAEQLERLASSSYLRAMDSVRQEDKKTRAALKLIADNHEQRAMRWHRTLTMNQSPHAATTAAAVGPSHIVTTTATPTPSERYGPFDLMPPTNDPNTTSTATTHADDDKSLSLRTAASEMEELYERLKELGLGPSASRGHPSQPHHHAQNSHQSMPQQQHLMKQHLSSDLGDSFCLLPKASLGKAPSSSLAAHRVDGGATLKAAAAHRMKNQREMLMEKQGSRRSFDHALTTPEKAMHQPSASPASAERTTSSDGSMDVEIDQLRTALAHQKFEANRLMHTIKTLGSENARLIQDTESMARLREENKRLVHAMDEFKAEYHQKFAVLKRALEEWWRQDATNQSQRSHDTSRQSMEALESKMEADLQILRDELAAEKEASRQKVWRVHVARMIMAVVAGRAAATIRILVQVAQGVGESKAADPRVECWGRQWTQLDDVVV